MREIKFRAWDKAEKTMKYFDYGIFNRIPFGLEDLSELMQYTGLKDKNGTEIYEGDIVHYCGGEYWYGCWEYEGAITIKNMVYDCFMLAEHEFIEVIENIYENPELLKEDE